MPTWRDIRAITWADLRRWARHRWGAARALVRGSELWLIILAIGAGAIAGGMVTGISALAQHLHEALYGLDPGQRLSAADEITLVPGFFMPAAGGLLLGIAVMLLRRWRKRVPVDPIEANALHGGRMSITDSIIVTSQTIVSSGFGASVGLEAGHTQMSAAVSSRLGRAFRLRRNDLRVLVGCGAAAAISAAFDAPLTGAFYAFELIIGGYSVATVAPVMAAALAANLMANAFGVVNDPIHVAATTPTGTLAYTVFIMLGFACGMAGIGIMRAVTLVEQGFRRVRMPDMVRPMLGGLLLGAMALITPKILGAGHGAMHRILEEPLSIGALAMIFLLKVAASAVSLGSGFRGGLFFASLFLGALLGKLVASILLFLMPTIGLDPIATAVVGMTALAVAVIGGPLTMTFLALEMTGDFVITGIVLAAAIVSSVTVRELFGYSFSTWRLHLRGETIRSAQDVSWIRSLTAGRMMRREVRTVRDSMTLAEFRNQFPLGSTQRVVAVDEADRYAGIITVSDAFASETQSDPKLSRVADLLAQRDDMLLPQLNIRDAIAAFDRTESEALVVVDDKEKRGVLGLLTEAHALRRYSEELDKARKNLSGD